MAEWIFWSAVALVGYSYVLYPLLLGVLTRFIAKSPVDGHISGARRIGERPAVTCIIAAYNEEGHIEARIDNILGQTYDPAKLMLHVGSDGSRDRTGELIARRHGLRVRASVFEKNRGKASVLNDLVEASSSPILVFSDANTMFLPDAVERLVDCFADPRVGAVVGELKLLDANGSNRDSAYWRIEQSLKRGEARLGGLLGANGAIYAMRRELYRPIAADTIVDDFCIAMTVAAEGHQLVYEPRAVALEDTPDEIADEYRRRVRIGIGNYQALFRHPEYLTRTNWATRFAYVSHKVLRWLTPHLLLVALAASALLAAESQFYLAAFVTQFCVYACALVVWRFGLERKLPRLAALAYLFVTLNWAFLVAFVRYLTGRYGGSWTSTVRSMGKSELPSAGGQ